MADRHPWQMPSKELGSITVSKEAVAASLQDEGAFVKSARESIDRSIDFHNRLRPVVGFRNYEMMTNEGPIPILSMKECHKLDNILKINTECMHRTPPKPDPRSRFKKFIDEWRHRLAHAWSALRGYDCD